MVSRQDAGARARAGLPLEPGATDALPDVVATRGMTRRRASATNPIANAACRTNVGFIAVRHVVRADLREA